MLVLEESGRVSGTYKVVLIVLMYISVSPGGVRKYEISFEALLLNSSVYECSAIVHEYVCSLMDRSEDNDLIERLHIPHGYSPGKYYPRSDKSGLASY